MRPTLGIMITATTYGTWLRGDRRGWIDDGKLMPPSPGLEDADRERMEHPPFVFGAEQLLEVGDLMGRSLVTRLAAPIFALHVGSWHFHVVIGVQPCDVPAAVKCGKDAVRFGLRPSRPIWTAGYDKRYCFDEASLRGRIRYVERHNKRAGLPPRPWPFITPP
ncbi:hypothetical protein [Lacipirellula sp.]|uniref:hypothetical protein n=1 Tax=Lacipirellula sp. TaxID=2691419 RepID=UPI003D0DBC34